MQILNLKVFYDIFRRDRLIFRAVTYYLYQLLSKSKQNEVSQKAKVI